MMEQLAILSLQSLFIAAAVGVVGFYTVLTIVRVAYEIVEKSTVVLRAGFEQTKQLLHTASQTEPAEVVPFSRRLPRAS